MANSTQFWTAYNHTTAATSNTIMDDLPPLPTYTLSPQGSLLSCISDFWLALILPVAAYWLFSGFFELLDYFDLFAQYRLHTPEEILHRNKVSRKDVAKAVFQQQAVQTVISALLSWFDAGIVGREDYDIARWAIRIRLAQRSLPQLLALIGLNAGAMSQKVAGSYPILGAVLAGGKYSLDLTDIATSPVFAAWEITAAKALYWGVVPLCQMLFAAFIMDTWQYALHRTMHSNKFLFRTFHAHHHQLYVPYAFGALYNHIAEGVVLDTLGAVIAYLCAFMTPRLGMLFFTISTIKTVDDHCGYKFPWDPFQVITGNNASYHDIHHQSWGKDTNFSQPFFTFWDRVLGTVWVGDTKPGYDKGKKFAEAKHREQLAEMQS